MSGPAYQVGRESMLVPGGSLIVECLWDKCVSAACVQRAPSWTNWRRGDPWVGKRAGMQSGVPGRQRFLASTQGSNKCACTCETGECHVRLH